MMDWDWMWNKYREGEGLIPVFFLWAPELCVVGIYELRYQRWGAFLNTVSTKRGGEPVIYWAVIMYPEAQLCSRDCVCVCVHVRTQEHLFMRRGCKRIWNLDMVSHSSKPISGRKIAAMWKPVWGCRVRPCCNKQAKMKTSKKNHLTLSLLLSGNWQNCVYKCNSAYWFLV